MRKLLVLLFIFIISACTYQPDRQVSWEECCALDTGALMEFIQFNREIKDANAKNQDEILKSGWSRLENINNEIQRQTDQQEIDDPENSSVKLALDQLNQLADPEYRSNKWPIDIGQEGYANQLSEINQQLKKIEEALVAE